jgi:hypothetical protein
VTKPPPFDSIEEEPLEELEDDAVIAQQAALHSPARRVNVVEEQRTVVVSNDADDTSKMRRLEPGRHDPTLVLRAVRHPPPQYAVPRGPPPAATPAWVAWVVWGIAGLIAFGIGGAVAIALSRRAPHATPPTVATSTRP